MIRASLSGGEQEQPRSSHLIGCAAKGCSGEHADADMADLIASAARTGEPWHHAYGSGGNVPNGTVFMDDPRLEQ